MTATLFQPPLRLGGPMEIRNRIVSTGHDTTLPTDDRVNDALIAYHRARAAGGVGLIVSQVTGGVHETARYTSHVLMGGVDDGCIAGFAELAQAVQAEGGAKLVVQLFHPPGREIMETSDGTLPVAYAPLPCRPSGFTPSHAL